MLEAIIFYSSLLVCISLGSNYKKIDDIEMKRNYGAGLGFLVTCLMSGPYLYHSVFMIWGNVIIIKCCDKRYVHHVSLAYTWTYLIYLHCSLSPSMYFKCIYQAISLRLVGLAFEVKMASREKTKKPNGPAVQSLASLMAKEPTTVDIIAYAYFFVGLHRGPYYRWRVFDDHFNTPFGVLGDCRIITEKKFKKAFVCGIMYALLKMIYSPETYSEEEFYTNRSSDYRYLYNVPLLIMYFLIHQTMMNLSICVCTETGFGVYPAKSMPMPGCGPTVGQSLLKLASTTEIALEQEYNFSVLESYESDKLILGPKMNDTTRAWDMPTRYWFWEYMYRNFIKANKEVRSAVSFLAWTIWCGPSVRQAIISCTMWTYVHLEREYVHLFDTAGSLQRPWDIGFSIMRMFCLIYLTPCFVIMETDALLKYYNSIYWAFHCVLLAFMVFAVIGYKLRSPVADQMPMRGGTSKIKLNTQ